MPREICKTIKLKSEVKSRLVIKIQSASSIPRSPWNPAERTEGFPVPRDRFRAMWHTELIYRGDIIISVPTGCRSTNRKSLSRLSLLPSVGSNAETRDTSFARKLLTEYKWQRSIDGQPTRRKDIRILFRFIRVLTLVYNVFFVSCFLFFATFYVFIFSTLILFFILCRSK